jgi:hypothetical protein
MGAINGHHGLLIAGGSSFPADPYFSSVSALHHFEVAFDGSNQTTDVKGKVWTRNNSNPKISTGWSKNGNSSLLFDVGGGYVSTPAHADFAFGSADYCIECFPNASSMSNDRCLIDTRDASTTGIALYTSTSANAGKISVANNSAVIATSSGTFTPSGQHLALYKLSGTVYVAVGGTIVITVADSRTLGTCPIRLGADYTGGALTSGYMDDLRITKGQARYGSSNFTPPAGFADF